MGNALGHHKHENKPHLDRKSEKESTTKVKQQKTSDKESQEKVKQQKTNEKGDARKQKHDYQASEVDTEIDESSHVTGGDSESCFFHSAENVSISPDLDLFSRRHHELDPILSQASSKFNQHPHIFSSQDFEDDFSLEACIPPEIARSKAQNDTSLATRVFSGDLHTGTSSGSTSRPEPEVTTECAHDSPVTAVEHTDIPAVSDFLICPLTPEQEGDQYQSQKVGSSSPSTGCHHPHFYNHHNDRKYQRSGHHQSSSPHTQRSLSFKMATSTCKSVSSANSSASHTSPFPQALSHMPSLPSPLPNSRAGNFLALFRSKSEVDDAVTSDREDRQITKPSALGSIHNSSNDEFKVKSKPMWKTWERSRSLQSQEETLTKVSVFGTPRKTDQNTREVLVKDVVTRQVEDVTVSDHSRKGSSSQSGRNIERRHGSSKAANLTDQHDVCEVSSCQRGQLSHERSGQLTSVACTESEQVSRGPSPLLSPTAAVCILKLEELERSIEKTIRDKFPDAEPFLLRKQFNEDLRSSRSLPTTPSLNKKLYLTREEDIVTSKQSDDKGATRFCDESYAPDPARSPVILRRFGTRTRHASISPKLARAKTAALFNSPSEMSNLTPSMAARVVAAKGPAYQPAPGQVLSPTLGPAYHIQAAPGQVLSPTLDGLFSASHKSEFRYVTDAGMRPDTRCAFHQGRLNKDNHDHVLETVSHEDNKTGKNTPPVIQPTLSAVFGSVSPKLRRHNQNVFNDTNHSADTERTLTAGSGRSQFEKCNNKPHNKHSITSLEDRQVITTVMAPSVTGFVSSENRHDKRHRGISDGFDPHLGKDNERSIRETRDKSCVGARAENSSDVDRVENTYVEKEPHQQTTAKSGAVIKPTQQHTAGRLGISRNKKKPDSHQFSHSARVENVPSTKPPEMCSKTKNGKPDQAASRDAALEQSTDDAVFGLSAALACRTSGQGSCASTSTQHTQAARHYHDSGSSSESQQASVLSHQVSIVSKQSLFVSQETLIASQEASVVSQETLIASQEASVVSQQALVENWQTESKHLICSPALIGPDVVSVPLLPGRHGVSLNHGNSTVGNIGQDHSVGINTRKLNVVLPNRSEAFPSTSLSDSSSPLIGQKELAHELKSTDNNCKHRQQRNERSEHLPPLQEGEKQDWQRSHDSEILIVLKQPVSEVISQMISLSQRLSQPKQAHLPQKESQAHLPLQESQEHIPQQESQEHLPLQESQEHIPQQESQEHLPQQESQGHLSQKESQAHLPQQDSQEHLPQQESQEHIPQQDSQEHLPHYESQAHLPQQENHARLSKQQKHSLPEIDSVSPECSIAHTKPVVATVTLPNYQQPCQTLEQKVMITQSNSLRNIDHDKSQTVSHAILKYPDTRTDESLRRHNSPEAFKKWQISDSGRSFIFSRSISDTGMTEDEKIAETGNLSEFVGRVLSVSMRETRAAEGDKVPPPSPTSIHQLMEELFEEEEDVANNDDDIKGEEAMAILNREHEMKQFTEIITKRLSDFLESKSISSLAIDTDLSVEGDALRPCGSNELELSAEVNAHQEIGSASIYDVLVTNAEVNAHQEIGSASRYDVLVTNAEVNAHQEIGSASIYDVLDTPTAAAFCSSPTSLIKVLTIESSSSLTTTTSSESDIDEPPLMFQTFHNSQQSGDFNKAFDNLKKSSDPSDFRELPIGRQSGGVDKRCTSRVYHSDDDVATGRGIPDYYDDIPLWSRQQKPPGQLSVTMMAVRWRERRDRWLTKRRRNKTDLMRMSTGSSDTGSEKCATRGYSLMRESSDCFDEENYQTKTTCTNEMGSGILTSPKYTKPILPFFDSIQTGCLFEDLSKRPLSTKPRDKNISYHQSHVRQDQYSRSEEKTDCVHGRGQTEHNRLADDVQASSDIAPPTVEDTFQELCLVQNILEKMQEWKPKAIDDSHRECLPLTTENVRSIREYYRDCSLSGGGRRSRLSATDRTESDLDVYSEMPDEVSSGSELYADDEGDDEGQEICATAEEELETPCIASKLCVGCQGDSKRCDGCQRERKNVSDTSVVIGCTFYNSSSQSGKRCDQNEGSSSDQTASAQRSTFGHSCYAAPNSDEEFWAGSAAAMEDSCKQLDIAADAVSSTFQNARVQMHDIQYHLQSLRRQMEVMQDDLTNISITLTPNTSVHHTGK